MNYETSEKAKAKETSDAEKAKTKEISFASLVVIEVNEDIQKCCKCLPILYTMICLIIVGGVDLVLQIYWIHTIGNFSTLFYCPMNSLLFKHLKIIPQELSQAPYLY